MAEAVVVSEANFEDEVLNSDVPVLVDFWAEWCGPCKMVAPVVESLAETYAGRLKVAKVDVDQNQALAQKYNVMSIPNLLFFRDGQVADQHIGYASESQLSAKVDSVLV